MKKFIPIIITIFTFTILLGISYYIHVKENNNYIKININDLEKKINDKDSFILTIINSSSENNKNFSKDLKLITEKELVKIYYIDINNLGTKDITLLMNVVSYDTVPTLAFINKGKELDRKNRLFGYDYNTKEKIITILTKNNYLK